METDKRVTRGMPNNPEAEASVLGAVLIDDKAADVIIPKLSEEDFYISQNRIIYSAMKSLQDASKPIDTVSVSDALELEGKLDEVGSIAYLSELAEGVPSAANAEYYARIIKRDSLIRKVIEAGNQIAKYGYDCEEGNDALENAERQIYKIAEEKGEKSLLKADDALAKAMNNIQDAQTGNVPQNVIFTDFPQLDRKTRGLKPGEMVLLAARPSVGKTAFALNIAANSCLKHGKSVAIFSLEMPDYLLVKRMLAYVSGVSLSRMDTRGGLTDSDSAKLQRAYNALLSASLYIDDYSINGPGDVLSKCRRLKRENGLDLIIIDYLQLMTSGSSGKRAPESRQVEVSEMSRKMKIYAKELDVPIVLLSQLSRGIEKREDHSPMLSDLRESGSIEQDADIVMFLHNPSKFNPALPENQIKLDVKKNRNGPIGEITLEWDGETTSFKECLDGADSEYRPAEKKADAKDNKQKVEYNSSTAGEEDDGLVPVSETELPFDNADEAPFELAASDLSDADEGSLPFDADDGAPLPDDDDAPFDTDDEYEDDGDPDGLDPDREQ